jgi:hypothetical protein
MHKKLAWFVLLIVYCSAHALSSAPPPVVVEVKVANSFVSLGGPWKFAPGDSPSSGDTLLWANPAFDDAAWAPMDLHPKSGAIDTGYGESGYLTGWAARGFPHLWGYAWYRLRLHVADPGQSLWLKMPPHEDDAYQVFANGQYVGEFGHFTPKSVVCYRSRSLMFQLPPPDEHGNILLAVRFYMEPWVLYGGSTADSGGMHETPLVGLEAQVESIRQAEVRTRILGVLADAFVSIFLLIAAAGAFGLWLIDRSSKVYLWLAAALVCGASHAYLLLISFFTYTMSQSLALALNSIPTTLGIVCWIQFWRRWFQLEKGRPFNLLLILTAVINIVVQAMYFFNVVPTASIPFRLGIVTVCNGFLGILFFVPIVQGARKDRTAALVALGPMLLLFVSLFEIVLQDWLRIPTVVYIFGLRIDLGGPGLLLLVLAIGVLVLRRFVNTQVVQRLERQTIDQELEQARELQQHVLVPEPVESKHFIVETAYHPARTVGGDFFQIVPYADGSLLVVIGDVSGKGIAAAMLVAVLVGAIRTRAEETADPAAILHTLNQRLLGRAGSHFATCIVAHLLPDGTVQIANAGHLSPYQDGRELELPGALPLGIHADDIYETLRFELLPGQHLTFMTDGVIEAQGPAGELFGFQRTQSISNQSAPAIADTAKNFGQEDDITVLTLTLIPEAVHA